MDGAAVANEANERQANGAQTPSASHSRSPGSARAASEVGPETLALPRGRRFQGGRILR
jgi:hypothetical protein